MAFYQKAWDAIKHAILAVPNHFHHHSHMVKSFNVSFILIPKRKGAMELRKYKPKSLQATRLLSLREVMDWKLKSGGNGLLLKLDVEKPLTN